MVDRTPYTDEAHTPKIALRQIFGRRSLREGLCVAAANAGLLSVEVFAMLGDTAKKAKDTIKAMIPEGQLGGSQAERDLAVMQLAAVWLACQALQTRWPKKITPSLELGCARRCARTPRRASATRENRARSSSKSSTATS